MFGWIITGIIALPLVILALFLFKGKGAFLIAGYNTLSDDKKAEYDTKALCKAVGWLLLLLAFFMMLFPLAISTEITWLFWVSFVPIMILPFGFVIYANTGNRFRKTPPPDGSTAIVEKKPMSRVKKLLLIIFILLSAQLCIGIGIMIYHGETDPKVSVTSDSIKISTLFGTDISFSSISDITLIPKNMREIGIGRRTNGYGSDGMSLKGTFQSIEHGHQLLFVYSISSPTIHISINRGVDVYISFRDSEKTDSVYRMISTSFANR